MGGRGSKSQMSGGVSVGAAGGGGGLNGPAAQFQVQTNPPNIVPTAQQAAQLNSSVFALSEHELAHGERSAVERKPAVYAAAHDGGDAQSGL